MNPIVEFDQNITLAINSVYNDNFDMFFYYMSNSKIVWFGLGAVLIFFIFKKVKPNYRKALIFLLFMAVSILICDQLCNVFKHSVQRFRPCWDETIMDQVHIVNGNRGGKYGFFSAHAAIFFTIAYLTIKFFKSNWYTVLIYFIAILFAYSRIYLGRHFVGDVVCGAIAGTLVAWGVFFGFQKFIAKYNRKHPHQRTSKK